MSRSCHRRAIWQPRKTPMIERMRWSSCVLAACAVLVAGCGNDTPTAPTETTETTVAEPTTQEAFAGTLPVGGVKFYSFTTAENGTINVTLTDVGGEYVPATVMISLALGQPSGTDCSQNQSVTTAAGTTAQITGTYAPDVYCVRVADIGNLFAPASFSVTVAYP